MRREDTYTSKNEPEAECTTQPDLSRKETEKQEDYCEHTEIKDWEDEGGAYIDRTHAVFRISSVVP